MCFASYSCFGCHRISTVLLEIWLVSNSTLINCNCIFILSSTSLILFQSASFLSGRYDLLLETCLHFYCFSPWIPWTLFNCVDCPCCYILLVLFLLQSSSVRWFLCWSSSLIKHEDMLLFWRGSIWRGHMKHLNFISLGYRLLNLFIDFS